MAVVELFSGMTGGHRLRVRSSSASLNASPSTLARSPPNFDTHRHHDSRQTG